MYNFTLEGSPTIILYPGNPPLLQYSHLGNTNGNHGNVFLGVIQPIGEDGALKCCSSAVDTSSFARKGCGV